MTTERVKRILDLAAQLEDDGYEELIAALRVPHRPSPRAAISFYDDPDFDRAAFSVLPLDQLDQMMVTGEMPPCMTDVNRDDTTRADDDGMTDDERARLRRELDASLDEVDAGETENMADAAGEWRSKLEEPPPEHLRWTEEEIDRRVDALEAAEARGETGVIPLSVDEVIARVRQHGRITAIVSELDDVERGELARELGLSAGDGREEGGPERPRWTEDEIERRMADLRAAEARGETGCLPPMTFDELEALVRRGADMPDEQWRRADLAALLAEMRAKAKGGKP
ncbi:MAG: hypothetical protein FWD17_10390 [Polyangiaceae bacterium]|nr:hypothetical protein [Polyangiaceae bacterium]